MVLISAVILPVLTSEYICSRDSRLLAPASLICFGVVDLSCRGLIALIARSSSGLLLKMVSRAPIAIPGAFSRLNASPDGATALNSSTGGFSGTVRSHSLVLAAHSIIHSLNAHSLVHASNASFVAVQNIHFLPIASSASFVICLSTCLTESACLLRPANPPGIILRIFIAASALAFATGSVSMSCARDVICSSVHPSHFIPSIFSLLHSNAGAVISPICLRRYSVPLVVPTSLAFGLGGSVFMMFPSMSVNALPIPSPTPLTTATHVVIPNALSSGFHLYAS